MSERRYGWVMVALGAFMTCIAVGAMFSLAVFLQPITRDTGWSTTAVSGAMTLNFLAMGWISERRGLAVALVSVGVGVAPVTMSPFAAWLITQMDWRHAQAVIAALVWATLVPAALFVRRPPAEPAAAPGAPEGPPMKLRDAFLSAPFIVLALTFFACCAAHAGPIFHTVTYAMTCGIAPLAAVTVYSVEGLAGLGGRLALGVAADRLGVKRVLIAGLVIQALAAFAFISASRLGEFYAVAAAFGF